MSKTAIDTPSVGDDQVLDEAPQIPAQTTDDPIASEQSDAIQTPTALAFRADSGASRSTWIAAALVFGIVAWMGSGFVFPSQEAAVVVTREAPRPVAVAVETVTSEKVTQYYQAEGQALPDRDTILRSETSGDVAEVLVRKGQDVAMGDVIARLDPTRNIADVSRAAEELARAQREFDNAQTLLERGVSTADRVSVARAALAAAQAQVAAAADEAQSLTITAPFAGRVEMLDIDQGEYVAAGTEVGRLVDITPLTVAIQASQQSLNALSVGQIASVNFITGEEREGVVSFVGTSAAAETRTFLVEVEVPNDDGAIPAGISAEVIIPTGEVSAHFLSPSIVSLDSQGQLGVKTVDSNNVVQFYPTELVRAQIDGVWVAGLPEEVDLITVGQGYVNAGETVAPMPGEDAQ
ncbi:multidrug efflux system membrane fusion protein [Pacificibacter maritimus]|uniref:Multidrug efflux system membrane fusion protein n=1 Tax=Pacificibacter maritimus TaxID=762213 RepID=A0A3N4UQM5_9RHOB|nr:efflux RND transporter periplasmic adaptor subunit [Pacificibacter maritimus]RPE70955.1 multidrug efflux system membrane fusion protein [Pacificibacter maritimus]